MLRKEYDVHASQVAHPATQTARSNKVPANVATPSSDTEAREVQISKSPKTNGDRSKALYRKGDSIEEVYVTKLLQHGK